MSKKISSKESKKAIVKPELIHLHGIRVIKAHIEMASKLMDEPQEIDGFSVGAKSESGFNLDKNFLRFRLFIKIKGRGKKGKSIPINGEYIIEFHYLIENLKSFAHFPKDDYMIEEAIGATIAGISYSTSRGIVLERTLGTDFGGIILPVIDPAELIRKDTFTQKTGKKKASKK